jgi:hypothetical protein
MVSFPSLASASLATLAMAALLMRLPERLRLVRLEGVVAPEVEAELELKGCCCLL